MFSAVCYILTKMCISSLLPEKQTQFLPNQQTCVFLLVAKQMQSMHMQYEVQYVHLILNQTQLVEITFKRRPQSIFNVISTN